MINPYLYTTVSGKGTANPKAYPPVANVGPVTSFGPESSFGPDKDSNGSGSNGPANGSVYPS